MNKILLSIVSFTMLGHAYSYSQDYDLKRAFAEGNVAPVAVLGSGPAGYSAAMQTALAGL